MPPQFLNDTLTLAQLDEAAETLSNVQLDQVTTLNITSTVQDVDRLFTFLARLPNLASLTLTGQRDQHHPAAPPSLDIAPLLTHFNGPLSLAILLVPGRPVENLGISPASYPRGQHPDIQDLSPLARYTEHVKSVTLKSFLWREGCFPNLAAIFPDLTVLDVGVVHEDAPHVPRVSESSVMIWHWITDGYVCSTGLRTTCPMW